MLEFIKTFIKSYLFPILKEAVAQAVVHQIEDSVYGPRRRPARRVGYGQYGRPSGYIKPEHYSDED
ncbi:MAG TPA: hypothetical protein PKD16_02185 [Saprospiraceae bacterium]|jgi:hypothetical protein|nr:hypothetical protein [Saprospiraceae bacterium]